MTEHAVVKRIAMANAAKLEHAMEIVRRTNPKSPIAIGVQCSIGIKVLFLMP